MASQGASGAVNAIVLFSCLLQPTRIIYLNFIIPVPSILLGVLYVGQDLYGAAMVSATKSATTHTIHAPLEISLKALPMCTAHSHHYPSSALPFSCPSIRFPSLSFGPLPLAHLNTPKPLTCHSCLHPTLSPVHCAHACYHDSVACNGSVNKSVSTTATKLLATASRFYQPVPLSQAFETACCVAMQPVQAVPAGWPVLPGGAALPSLLHPPTVGQQQLVWVDPHGSILCMGPPRLPLSSLPISRLGRALPFCLLHARGARQFFFPPRARSARRFSACLPVVRPEARGGFCRLLRRPGGPRVGPSRRRPDPALPGPAQSRPCPQPFPVARRGALGGPLAPPPQVASTGDGRGDLGEGAARRPSRLRCGPALPCRPALALPGPAILPRPCLGPALPGPAPVFVAALPSCRPCCCRALCWDCKAKVEPFWEFMRQMHSLHDYPLDLIVNADQTPLFLEMPAERTLEMKGARTVHVRSAGYEKECVIVMLAITASGPKIPPYVVFKRKTAPKVPIPSGKSTMFTMLVGALARLSTQLSLTC
ncbi:unnamed protein product [Closterium sp. NIES-54]